MSEVGAEQIEDHARDIQSSVGEIMDVLQQREELTEQVQMLKKENNEFRKVLSFVIELDCIDWNRNELAEMARKVLAGEFNE